MTNTATAQEIELYNAINGDTVYFKNGGTAKIESVTNRNDDSLPLKIKFQGFQAHSHYGDDGEALPNRGTSPHDIVKVLATGNRVTATLNLQAGTRVKHGLRDAIFVGMMAPTIATLIYSDSQSGFAQLSELTLA